MKLDRARIDHLAKLASLSLDDAEAARMTDEIGAILKYVDELAAVDTSDVPPTANVQLGRTATRADAVAEGLSHDAALAGAPRTADEGFAVPGFLEGGS
jgi:aspartyl-tRNA(Asn)/glutamyl-tRNA(Gln) amidotransferase subunit C